MSAERLTAAMKAADELTKTDGVRQKGNKQYLEVKHRITVFRRHFGLELGIETELLHACDKYVRIAAKITDAAGRVIGSGLAEEVRGSSGVTATSAIEVGETSAIGRALASLSLHGGEYASLNEIEIARAHEQQLKQPPEEKPKPVPTITVSKTNDPPFDDSDTHEVYDWPSWSATAKQEILAETTEGGLVRWNTKNGVEIDKFEKHSEFLFNDVRGHYINAMKKWRFNQNKA